MIGGNALKRVIKKPCENEKGYVRYVCPVCMSTLLISDEKVPPELPTSCGHCGAEIEEEKE